MTEDEKRKFDEMFSALTQLNFDILDKEQRLAKVSARADGLDAAIHKIVAKIEAAQKPGVRIRPKDFILDLYRIAITAAVTFPPDTKAATVRITR